MRDCGGIRRAALLALLMVSGGELVAQGSTVTVRPSQPTGGAIAGIVRDPAGEPIPDVRILIEGLARQTRTSPTGGFVLEGLPAGTHALRFRKLGYREAQAELTVIRDSAITVGVTLVPAAEQLDPVVIEATVLNQVTGLVTDENGTPLEGVVVEVLGLDLRLETNAQGRYVLLDLKPGNYLLQFRAPGFRVSQYGLRMVAQIERDITTKLLPARRGDRMSVATAAAVALEAHRRQALRGAQSVLLGRDELERFDTAPLSVALMNSRAGIAMQNVNADCVLLNGYEPLTTGTLADQRRSLNAAEDAARFFGTARAPVAQELPRSARGSSAWLDYFRANEVELVEIYEPGSEISRSVCARFPPSSGCACVGAPSAIVLWLRR